MILTKNRKQFQKNQNVAKNYNVQDEREKKCKSNFHLYYQAEAYKFIKKENQPQLYVERRTDRATC